MTYQPSSFSFDHIDLLSAVYHKKKEAGDTDFFSWKVFKKGEYLYFPGENADRVYFVSDGRVKTGNYSITGKEITKSIVVKGEAFGEHILYDCDICSFSRACLDNAGNLVARRAF